MLDSYFFIPADKKKFLNKKKELKADYFVFDFEDAVSEKNKNIAFENAMNFECGKDVFFRLPFLESKYSREELQKLSLKCKGNIVIPKISSTKEIDEVFNIICDIKEINAIILIETPQGYININDILSKHADKISAIGFGSHDFCSITGIKHSLKYLKNIKINLNIIAKAYGKKFIDGVDVNIRTHDNLRKECLYAFKIGADAKFLIHPTQIDILNEADYLSLTERNKIINIFEKTKKIDLTEIDVIEVDGEVYEKPHISRIRRIINKVKR